MKSINSVIFNILSGITLIWSCASFATTPPNQNPSFDCKLLKPNSIEDLICKNKALSALDRKLASVYGAALKKAINDHPHLLKAEQIGWIKGRNECWKSDDKLNCIKEYYQLRIAELQSRYRLVPGIGPIIFTCDEKSANEVVVNFFKTEPQSLIAERGDSVSIMYQQPRASGTKYQGRNESFWEHQGEALITWGYQMPEMHCKKK